MLLKEALLDILIKLADDFDRTDNEAATEVVDEIIQGLTSEKEIQPPTFEIEVDEDERAEIENILEQALKSMKSE
jgi:hypothetical protein